MIVNADRKGPKDFLDLAHKANAFKSFAESKIALDNASTPEERAAAQGYHDDNFEYLMSLHNNDPAELQATAGYLQDRITKGKAN